MSLDLPLMDRPVAEAWAAWTPEQRETFLRALVRKLFAAPKRETTAEVAQRHAHDPVNGYHAHLDVCKRCRERPFDLCQIGAEALRREALG
jgi:hypothetical protein